MSRLRIRGVFIVSKIRYNLYDQINARTNPLLTRKMASLFKRSYPIAPILNIYADIRIARRVSMMCWELELALVHNL